MIPLSTKWVRWRPNTKRLDVPNIIDNKEILRSIRHTTCAAVTIWDCDSNFMSIYNKIKPYTLVPLHNLYSIWQLAKSAPSGSFWECGVYKGGVSLMLSIFRPVQMFDTFEGIAVKGPNDGHGVGEFAADEDFVKRLVPLGSTYKGIIPSKFFDDNIAFCKQARDDAKVKNVYLIQNKHTGWNKSYNSNTKIKCIKNIMEFEL